MSMFWRQNSSSNNAPSESSKTIQVPVEETKKIDPEKGVETEALIAVPVTENGNENGTTAIENGDAPKPSSAASKASRIGLYVLILLAVQNCSKNLLMRFIMKEKPKFLTSAAVIGVEIVKLVLSTLYIVLVEKRSLGTIYTFLKEDYRNTLLLGVPAAAYSLQMSLEYVALANIDAAVFSVTVQTKLLSTAIFSLLVLRKKFKYIQIISLTLLTAGVMLCNLQNVKPGEGGDDDGSMIDKSTMTGIMATLGIALSSGFAAVYTEKVIKGSGQKDPNKVDIRKKYSLAYIQVQLAVVSLVIIGAYAMIIDYKVIVSEGLWTGFTHGAMFSVFNSAIGGLIVAAVLKFADAILKGYATAISVVMTGVLSMLMFGTSLNMIYFLGIINVVSAVLLYNGKDKLNQYMC